MRNDVRALASLTCEATDDGGGDDERKLAHFGDDKLRRILAAAELPPLLPALFDDEYWSRRVRTDAFSLEEAINSCSRDNDDGGGGVGRAPIVRKKLLGNNKRLPRRREPRHQRA